MSVLRQDPLTGRWVVLAAERAKRPEAFFHSAQPLPELTADCPFCPGSEVQTPPEILRIADNAPWQIRVVPNKYAALAPPAGLSPSGDSLHRSVPSGGAAEVVIETPEHIAPFDTLGPEHAANLIRVYQARYSDLVTCSGIEIVLVFRNHLPQSGASLLHPHSQILASAFLPPVLAAEADCFAVYQAKQEACLGCAMYAAEAAGELAIAQIADFLLLSPFAARSPFEILLLPRTHAADFLAADPLALAKALQDAFRRIRRGLNNPPVNFWLHCKPNSIITDFHWHIHILPRFTIEGGWELGTGLPINVVPPELAAAHLRLF
ncbi:MAG: DUF4931 domain-containing protein [Cyanobacteria bacterium NC_groundwater_1444_Ag_S-0.65um_54_12]|nr:DUF4931 domain-containing protein [Cyanobacteria bacterium NC_groundwater_1444_Ag_S-0.65um_54_12]